MRVTKKVAGRAYKFYLLSYAGEMYDDCVGTQSPVTDLWGLALGTQHRQKQEGVMEFGHFTELLSSYFAGCDASTFDAKAKDDESSDPPPPDPS